MKRLITAALLATLWFASTPASASAGGFHADVYIGVPYVPVPVYPYVGAAWYGYWGPPRGYWRPYGYGGYYGGYRNHYYGGHRHGGYRGKGGHGGYGGRGGGRHGGGHGRHR